MMEVLAKTTGDVEQVVDVLRRDLSGPHAYYRIAEAYVSAGRYDQALLWGERGLELFSAGREERLRELVADEYYRRGEHDAAIELAWKAFNRSRAWQATEHWSGMRRGREPGRFGATGL
jgi:tetratricopeptide (TPR) repeat protein